MIDRQFIEDQDLVKQMLGQLKATGQQIGYEKELYIDPETNQKWEKYKFEFLDHPEDGIGLRRYPYPKTDKIIEIALTSTHLDEIEGAAGLLREQEEYYKVEFREKLWKILDQPQNNIDSERYIILFERAELYDSTNVREVIGKHHTEIAKDAAHFASTAEKAIKLKNKIIAPNKNN